MVGDQATSVAGKDSPLLKLSPGTPERESACSAAPSTQGQGWPGTGARADPACLARGEKAAVFLDTV